ncbi:MAG: FG-GAP repeat domain-containing protein, partial [Thermoplasmata archaeon]
GDGIFSRALTTKTEKSWDGGIMILNATDLGGRETETRLVLRVLDTGTTTTPTFGPSSLTFGSDLQRYDIFEAVDWDVNSWGANSTREFVKGQTVAVVVATKSITNPDLKNSLILWDPYDDREAVYGNAPYTDPVTDTTKPSTTSAFSLIDYIEGFYIYENRFNTSSDAYGFDGVQLQLGHYSLEFELLTSLTSPPENRLYVADSIRVTDASGSSPDYPKVLTYKDADHTIPANDFNFTETMYVKLVVQNTDGSFNIGDVIVSDFVSRLPIWASPGSTPVSVAVLNDTTSYSFSVDLSKPNLDPWNFGTVSYNLAVKDVRDGNEDYSLLSKQVNVRGPRWKLDTTIGLRATQQVVFDTAIYGDFFDNIEGWKEYPFELLPSGPSFIAPDNPIEAHTLADLDGDGDLDVLAGTKEGDVRWYRNNDGSGHSMSSTTIDKLTDSVTSVGVGHIDEDSDLDAAAGTSTGDIWWYRNDGSWSPNFVDNVGTGVSVVRLADVNDDGAADLVVGLSLGSQSVRVYLNNGQGVFGTVTTSTILMRADVLTPGHGTVTGTYVDTHSSDNVYQQIDETTSNLTLVAGELSGTAETVQGTYNDTTADDDVFEIFTEGVAGTSYTIGLPGHRYLFPNITATVSDVLEIHFVGYVSSGNEPFAVGWSKDGTNVTWIGLVTTVAEAEYVWELSGIAWNDETLYLHIMDTDQSKDDKNSDSQLSSMSIDYIYLVRPGPGGVTSSLTKIWGSSTLPSGKDAYKFFIEAYHTLNSEGDDFTFKFAPLPNGPYYDLLTVTKTADDDVSQSVSLPTSVGGLALYVMVQDSDRTNGSSIPDSLWADHLYFQTYESTPQYWSINVGAPSKTATVADFDGDGRQDIAVATTGNKIYVFYGDGTGKNWPAKDPLTATGNLVAMDVGLISGDTAYDIVAGTDNGDVLLFTNGGSRGVWFLSVIISLSTTETSALRVGDVDGDYWDDIVFGTDNGFVVYMRSDQGQSWITTIIIQFSDALISGRIHSLDLGDADRNVIIRTHPY